MPESDWESMAAEYQEKYEQAEEFGNRWMPPDGDYTAALSSVAKGAVKDRKTQEVGPFLAPTLTIIDGDLKGKQFQWGYWSVNTFGRMKTEMKAVECPTPGNLLAAQQWLKDRIGDLVVTIKVGTRKSDDGREFTNAYVQQVHNVTPEPEAEPEPAPEEAPAEEAPAEAPAE